MMFPLKQNCLRTTVYLQTGVCLSYSKKIAFMLTSDSYSCCTIFNATFLLCSQRTCLEGIFYKMFVIAYKKMFYALLFGCFCVLNLSEFMKMLLVQLFCIPLMKNSFLSMFVNVYLNSYPIM